MGDNITPPQQAFNWVADVYGSTEEIKARGQVIVGLMHEDVGHLGIFVSGKVAKKEDTQIVVGAEVDRGAAARPVRHADRGEEGRRGKPSYEVSFVEAAPGRCVARLNRYKRADERPFEAVKAVSEFNQRAYELFGRPVVETVANEYGAKLAREFHPLRWQRWAISDLNPCCGGLRRARRRSRTSGRRFRQIIRRARRNRRYRSSRARRSIAIAHCATRWERPPSSRSTATSSPSISATGAASKRPRRRWTRASFRSSGMRWLQSTRAGYAEALARVAFLLAHKDEPLPLSRLQLADELIEEYRELLPDIPPMRRAASAASRKSSPATNRKRL
jgi:hypothetical protein